MVIVRHQQGRLGEFLPVIESVAADLSAMPAFLGAVAVSHLDAGEEAEALALLEAAAADGFSSLPMDIGWLDGVTAYAEVAIELHVEAAATLLLDLLAPFHGQLGFNGLMPLEPVAHYLGGLATVLGRWAESEAYFAESGQLNDRMGSRFSSARTDLSWARMLIERNVSGDAERARVLLERAHAAGAAHGYRGVERRAAAALRGMA